MNENKIYNQALEDFAKRLITYYGHLDTTQGASVQYFVEQIKRELTKEVRDEHCS
jgi:hypothetical protein